jgi:hypothetical protein
MRVASRSLLVCVLGCVVGLGWLSTAASGEEALSPTGPSSLLGSPLVVEGVQSLAGGELQAQEESVLASPETVRLNTESEVAHEGLSASGSQALVGQLFPGLVDELAGGPPPLGVGQTLEGFPTDYSMAVLEEGRRSVVESLQPVAVEVGSGRVPIDLSLGEAGDGFAPKTPQAGAKSSIPRRLSQGPALSGLGVGLTPVDEHGTPLEAEGVIDGATVFYGASEDAGVKDLSTVVKPTTGGFDLVSVLSSKLSPERLFFRVGMPEGASLAQGDSGSVQVVDAGEVIATVAVPGGRDADGRFVPLSVGVSGDTVVVTVARAPGQYAYPLVIDPYLAGKDENLTGNGTPTNWHFCTSVSSSCSHEEGPFRSTGWGGTEGLSDEATGEYKATEHAEFIYKTQGESKITEASMTSEATNNENPGAGIETTLHIRNENGTDDNSLLLSASKNYSATKSSISICLNCGGGKPEYHNTLTFIQAATEKGSHFHGRITAAAVKIEQEVEPTVTLDTTDEKLLVGGSELANVFYGKGGWMGPYSGAASYTVEDKGIGVSELDVYGFYEDLLGQKPLAEGKCSGVQCPQTVQQTFTYNGKLPEGPDPVTLQGFDAADGYGYVGAVLKVDAKKPTGLTLVGLPSGGVINDAPRKLYAQASDGLGSTKETSGIKSLTLGVDGYEVAGKSGSCEPGPCTAGGEWTLNGEEFGAGKHTITLVATDNAGNVETKSYEITIRHASPISVGPGSVDPLSGALTLGANDVSISDGYGTLGVSRSYDSRRLNAGESGPLGPQWSLAISGEQGIESEPVGGGVTLIGTDGSRTTFSSNGKGGFVSPSGDEGLVLSAEREGETVSAYLLSDPAEGTTVKFIHPSGASTNSLWVIASAEGSLSKQNGEKQTYAWETLEEEGKRIERPKQALAPPPPGVHCTLELKVGCRALSFAYATETTAKGEASSEWGQYKGRLIKVSVTAYNPASKAMATTAVAEYVYDKQGRLRAEWDPRISPALKSTYGYDGEGRVVAVSQPGQEPWLFHYGTIPSDPSPGRLLSAVRPPASTALGSGPAPSNESKPTLSSTTPVIGTTLSVASNGSWANSPLSYAYQWEDCEAKGEKCSAIPGAANQSYTPQARDAGYTLVASVTAINADGSGVSSTTQSSTVAVGAPKYSLKFGTLGEGAGQLKNPTGVAVDGAGNVWVVDHNNNRIEEFSSSGTFLAAIGWGVSNGEAKLQVCTSSCRAGIVGSGNGQFSTPDGIAIAEENIYVSDSGNDRIEELSTKGEFLRSFGTKGIEPGDLEDPVGVALAPNGNVWVADFANNRIDEFSATGTYLGYLGAPGGLPFGGKEPGQFKEPTGIAFSSEYAYVLDAGNERVQQLTLSGDYVAQFGSAGSGNGQFSKPAGIATEPVSGDLYVADDGNNRVQEFNPAGAFLASVGTVGEGEGQFKGVEGVAVTPSGSLYAADLGNDRVQRFTPTYSTSNPAPSPPSVGSNAVMTLEYEVPVSGTGAPYALGSKEVEAWAQTDDPVEASAMFPPDEPMGWPAQDYKRASVSYFDQYGRRVNTASPSGAISTSEYNETNNVVRTLSPANRAAALKEGTKSAEVSKLLDTQSTYSAQGTELLSTLGPRHTVKLSSGTEVQARDHIHDYYDEDAPGGETYDLLTKSTDGAEYEGKEADVRTTLTSYSGQENFGWLLRKPTSVTIDPEGLKLTTTTFYDPETGNAIETRTPVGGTGANLAGSYVYAAQQTSAGTTGTPSPIKAPASVLHDW